MLRVKIFLVALGAVVSAFVLSSCSSAEKRSDSPEGAFAIAQEFEEDSRFEEAVRRYQEVRTKFPYSKYATMAELAVANVYFKEESFAEAQVAYQAFRDLHPTHPQIDFVIFRTGMSYYNQLPGTIDRDLSLANNAIVNFNELIERFPNSEHMKEAQEKRDSATKMLAEKELYIADFYFKRKQFDSALRRYETLLKKYPNQGFDAQALSRAAISASRTGQLQSSKNHYSELQKKFPDSSELSQARKEIEQ